MRRVTIGFDVFIVMALMSAHLLANPLESDFSSRGMPEAPFGFVPLDAEGERFMTSAAGMSYVLDRSGLTLHLQGGEAIAQKFVNGSTLSKPEPGGLLAGMVQEYRGNQNDQWRQKVPTYSDLKFPNIYPGIDVQYRLENGHLKRDLLVAPGADPSQIEMAFSGGVRLKIQAGGVLVLQTESGELRETQPFLYQNRGTTQFRVAGHYELRGSDRVGFAIGSYDPALPLVIDPTLLGSGFFGGSGQDIGLAGFATDTGLYFTGRTTSLDFPTLNPHQSTHGGDPQGLGDAYLVRFDKATLALTYATYFGGSGSDQATGIYVDDSGNAYIAGWTRSADFPTQGAFQSTLNGTVDGSGPPPSDGFVAKFDASGALVWSTYVGGSGEDQLSDLGANNFFQILTVVGFSNSTNYPLLNASDTTCGCSTGTGVDAVVTRLNFDGTLNSSTYLGGDSVVSPANDVAMDVFAAGSSAYIVGWTEAINFPKQPFSADHAGGKDAFFAYFDSSGQLDFSLLLGGSGDEVGDGVAAFFQSQIVISGSTTSSTDFPVTANAQQAVYGGGASDAFIARLNMDTSPNKRSISYWGGSGNDAAREVHFSRDNNQLLTRYTLAGITDSPDFPLGGGKTSATSGGLDSFMIIGEPVGSSDFTVQVGTLFGGLGDDGIFSLRASLSDGPFSVLATGTTSDASSLPPSTPLLPDSFTGHSRGTRKDTGNEKIVHLRFCPENCVTPLQPDLEIEMQQVPAGPLVTGGQYFYEITITNLGDGPAANVSTHVTIPDARVISLSPTGSVTHENGQEVVTLTHLGGELLPNGSASFTVTFLALAPMQPVLGAFLFTSATAVPALGEQNLLNNLVSLPRAIQAEIPGGIGSTRIRDLPMAVGDPIATNNGAYFFQKTLLDLGGPMPLKAALVYGSDRVSLQNLGNLPRFWMTPFASLLVNVSLNGQLFASAQLPNGDILSFLKSAGDWELVTADVDLGFAIAGGNASQVQYQLLEHLGWFYLIDPHQAHVYLFEEQSGAALLRAVMDRNSNRHSFLYDLGDAHPPTAVIDGLGRRMDFEYVSFPGTLNLFLSKITDQGGREILFTYEASGADNAGQITLRSVTDAMGQVTGFAYAGAELPAQRMVRHILPNGDSPLQQTYDFQELNGRIAQRVTAQTHLPATDASSGTIPVEMLAYDPQSTRVTHTDLLGNLWDYQAQHHGGNTLQVVDPENLTLSFSLDGQGLLNGFQDRDDRQVSFGIHPKVGKIQTYQDPAGGTYTFQWQETAQSLMNPFSGNSFMATFFDLTQITFPDGSAIERVFDSRGNPSQITNREGEDFLFTHHTTGQVLTITNPAGGSVMRTYDANANLLTQGSSETDPIVLERDAWFRIHQITYPNGETETFQWNLNDRLIQTKDVRDQTTNATYDAMDQMTTRTGPDSDLQSLAYNRFGVPVEITDATQRVQSVTTDAANRLTALDDGSGEVRAISYNGAGFRTGTQRGGIGFNEVPSGEGLLLELAPSSGGPSLQLVREERGLIESMVTPEGRQFDFSYDALGRLQTLTEPSGKMTETIYDSEGEIVGRCYPGGREVSYTRNALGLIERIEDASGSFRTNSFSPMGLMSSTGDALGREATFARDSAGNLVQVTYPDGVVLHIQYEGTLITELVFTGPPAEGIPGMQSLSFSYDNRGNLLETDGIQMSYDLSNRLLGWNRGGVTFEQTFDSAGRLATLTYPDNAMTVTYTYDASGELASVSDSLTGTLIQLSYDSVGRRTEMLRSNGMDTQFTYSQDGFLTRIWDRDASEVTLLDFTYSFDSDGNLVAENQEAPVTADAGLVEREQVLAFDSASQITSPGFAYDARGRQTQDPEAGSLVWDLAGQLVAVGSATYTYDGLGHMRGASEAENLDFHTHPLLSASSVLFERTVGASAPNARSLFYIFTPDGELLYGVDRLAGDAPFYYHFDRQGAVRAITDESGGTLAAFAYGPFGEPLESPQRMGGEGTKESYLFGGKWGAFTRPTHIRIRQRNYLPGRSRFLSGDVEVASSPTFQITDEDFSSYTFAMNQPGNYQQSQGNDISPLDWGIRKIVITDPFGLLGCEESLPGILDRARIEPRFTRLGKRPVFPALPFQSAEPTPLFPGSNGSSAFEWYWIAQEFNKNQDQSLRFLKAWDSQELLPYFFIQEPPSPKKPILELYFYDQGVRELPRVTKPMKAGENPKAAVLKALQWVRFKFF